jgi:hypothetical protein
LKKKADGSRAGMELQLLPDERSENDPARANEDTALVAAAGFNNSGGDSAKVKNTERVANADSIDVAAEKEIDNETSLESGAKEK